MEEVLYFYTSMWQPHPFDELEKQGVKFRREIPHKGLIENLCDDKRPRIIVLDDMIQHVVEDDSLFQLLSRQVHHLNIMVLVTSQILHPRGKNAVSLISQGHGYFFFPIYYKQRRSEKTIERFTDRYHRDEKGHALL